MVGDPHPSKLWCPRWCWLVRHMPYVTSPLLLSPVVLLVATVGLSSLLLLACGTLFLLLLPPPLLFPLVSDLLMLTFTLTDTRVGSFPDTHLGFSLVSVL